jgi:hypothetical protein
MISPEPVRKVPRIEARAIGKLPSGELGMFHNGEETEMGLKGIMRRKWGSLVSKEGL